MPDATPHAARWRDGAVTRGDVMTFMAVWFALDVLELVVKLTWRLYHAG